MMRLFMWQCGGCYTRNVRHTFISTFFSHRIFLIPYVAQGLMRFLYTVFVSLSVAPSTLLLIVRAAGWMHSMGAGGRRNHPIVVERAYWFAASGSKKTFLLLKKYGLYNKPLDLIVSLWNVYKSMSLCTLRETRFSPWHDSDAPVKISV